MTCMLGFVCVLMNGSKHTHTHMLAHIHTQTNDRHILNCHIIYDDIGYKYIRQKQNKTLATYIHFTLVDHIEVVSFITCKYNMIISRMSFIQTQNIFFINNLL